MDGEIAAILAMDGIASGAIYVLIGLGFVLIFAVTRVIFVPFGDIAAFAALSLASLETGGRPGTIGLVAALALLATAIEATTLIRARNFGKPRGVRSVELVIVKVDSALRSAFSLHVVFATVRENV